MTSHNPLLPEWGSGKVAEGGGGVTLLTSLCVPPYSASPTPSHIMSLDVEPASLPSLSELKTLTDTEQRTQIVVTLAYFKVPTQL